MLFQFCSLKPSREKCRKRPLEMQKKKKTDSEKF